MVKREGISHTLKTIAYLLLYSRDFDLVLQFTEEHPEIRGVACLIASHTDDGTRQVFNALRQQYIRTEKRKGPILR